MTITNQILHNATNVVLKNQTTEIFEIEGYSVLVEATYAAYNEFEGMRVEIMNNSDEVGKMVAIYDSANYSCSLQTFLDFLEL